MRGNFMGVYIGLDIVPNEINQEDWQEVFEETLLLIQAYPFATYNVDNLDGFKRLVLDRTEEQSVDKYGLKEKYWKIIGDLESKETGESFTLFSSIAKYSEVKEERLKEDILLGFLNKDDWGAREVFYSKTQGKNYHNFILAIAALIENRLPMFACCYGDISIGQAQKAVDWANSLLDRPIDLPVRVNPPKLLKRLEVIEIEEKRLEALYELSIGANAELDGLIAEHFTINTVRNYFLNELQRFNSAAQIGAKLIIIRFLNTGLPLEVLVDICCFDNKGPRFESVDFIKAICSSWVFIDPKVREDIGVIKRRDHLPDSIESQFGSIFLNLGFIGRHTSRYIEKNDLLSIFKEKFHNAETEQIVNKEYKKIIECLKMKKLELKKIEEEYSAKKEKKIIETLDLLVFWDNTYMIGESIMNVIASIKGAVEEDMANKSNLIQMIGNAEEQGQLIKVLSQLIQEHHDLVLTREAWDWIENEANDVIKRMVVMLLTFESNSNLRKLYKALFENKDLFYTYMK